MSAYLTIKDLHKTFYPHGQPLKVLDGINLDVEKGEIPSSEMSRIEQMIEDISYYNAKNYFRF